MTGDGARRFLAAALTHVVAAGVLAAMAASGAPPAWLADVPAPPGNPLTREKAELGRHLFFDPRLSGPGTVACASCHRPELAFTDGRARAVGASGETLRRGAPSLANVAWMKALTWADPRVTSLERQARSPLFAEGPDEMGARGREEEILTRLRADARYAPLLAAAFPGEADPLNWDNLIRAVASFERTLISADSPYDRLLFEDDAEALSPAARRGMALFFSERTGCGTCHSGLALSDASRMRREGGDGSGSPYHETGLPGDGTSRPDAGLAEVTGRDEDAGRFRTPSLRNVAVTAPYMHDGRFDTLEQVIAHYASGAASTAFELSREEAADLVRFLESLTDETFLAEPRFRDPWTGNELSP